MVNPPPPIFLDTAGNLMSMENPVIEAPQGDVIQGTAMDIGEEKDAKGKDQVEVDEQQDDAKAAAAK